MPIGPIAQRRAIAGRCSVPEADAPATLNAVLISGADRFYIGHNHHSGELELEPTAKEIKLTEQMNMAAALNGLFLEDHWVIGPPDGVWSMREHGQFQPSAAITTLYTVNSPMRPHESLTAEHRSRLGMPP